MKFVAAQVNLSNLPRGATQRDKHAQKSLKEP